MKGQTFAFTANHAKKGTKGFLMVLVNLSAPGG